jgi:hypothetical protein
MSLDELIIEFENKKIVFVTENQLEQILSDTEQIIEENTIVNNFIRILKYQDYLLIQEMTDKNEIALRKAESLQQALAFIKERMELYDKMWDGCGCKIDYYI